MGLENLYLDPRKLLGEAVPMGRRHEQSEDLARDTLELLDGIVYDIDSNIIKCNTYFGSTDYNVIVLLGFKTGELNISANRESVQYDQPTIKKIQSVVDDLTSHMLGKINDLIDQQPNYYSACLLMDHIFKDYGKDNNIPYFNNILNIKKAELKYKDKLIEPLVPPDQSWPISRSDQ